MKDGAARAVLREAWLRGQRCVELQRDGRRTIFFCTRCGTRCYSDAALVDHLRGNLHARLSADVEAEKHTGSLAGGEERGIEVPVSEKDERVANPRESPPVDRRGAWGGGGGGSQVVMGGRNDGGGPSITALEWIGKGELFFSVRSTAGAGPIVDSSWFLWKGKGGRGSEWDSHSGQGGEIFYAVVMFPYSDMIGRGGDWKSCAADAKHAKSRGVAPECRQQSTPPASPTGSSMDFGAAVARSTSATASPNLPTEADQTECLSEQEKQQGRDGTGRVLRRACKRKKAKVVERLCFICHQRMTAGKDVAALLNLQTKQMVCGSRNKRGVFHVYHSSCLIDWISICELKMFTGQLDHRIDRSRKLTRTKRAVFEHSKLNQAIHGDGVSISCQEGAIFCPECQGTGLNIRGAQLERPRYRLAQVFDWILELVQARKAWTDSPKKQDTSRCGLLLRNDLEGLVESRGFVHFYSGCAELLTGNALEI